MLRHVVSEWLHTNKAHCTARLVEIMESVVISFSVIDTVLNVNALLIISLKRLIQRRAEHGSALQKQGANDL